MKTTDSVDPSVNTITCPDCRVFCGSLLVVGANEGAGIGEATVVSCIDDALEVITAGLTDPEEDYAANFDVVEGTWRAHVELGGEAAGFSVTRKRLTFYTFPLSEVGGAS